MPEAERPKPEQDNKGRFVAGNSGNGGRPRGARAKLGEAFIQAMFADFEEKGVEAIKVVRDTKPDQYLKVVASILPKEIEAGEQLAQFLKESRDAAVAAALRADN